MTTLTVARRTLATATATISGYGVWKAKYDPPHIIWDLDETLLYSVCPIPTHADGSSSRYPSDSSRYFEHIDDDFEFDDEGNPNTRTYWRPGSRTALSICRMFSHQHVFTAAQGSYTDNVLGQLDSSLFDSVLHRDLVPVKGGKDINHITDRLDRAVLFDDRVKNFVPQKGANGVQVVPYNRQRLEEDNRLTELQEVTRWIGIALMALLIPTDIRTILPYFQSPQHRERFSCRQPETTTTKRE